MSLFTLLEELDDPVHRSAFVELCIIGRAFSRKWILTKGILRMLQVSAKQNEIVLPAETNALFLDFEQQMWEKGDGERFSSLYPNPNSLAKSGGERHV